MMEKKQRGQEKVDDKELYSIWRERKNVEPKKKKGTLAKTAGRGGGFGRAGCRART